MATKKTAQPPKKKKEKPTPVPCLCGRQPVAAKAKGRGWIVACPAIVSCPHCPSSGAWPKEDQAVEKWNTTILELLQKEAKK